jgi:Ni,Fe-hydrogenase III small subunit
MHIRHVDAGSDGSAEMEIAALLNPIYDVNRLGIYFTASPRHADMLLVTGCGAPGMSEALRTTYDAMPFPKLVMAVGSDTISGDPAMCEEGLLPGYAAAEPDAYSGVAAHHVPGGDSGQDIDFGSTSSEGSVANTVVHETSASSEASPATSAFSDGIAAIIPVDLYVPGNPPSPLAVLRGILVAMGVVPLCHLDVSLHNNSSGYSDIAAGLPAGENDPFQGGYTDRRDGSL